MKCNILLNCIELEAESPIDFEILLEIERNGLKNICSSSKGFELYKLKLSFKRDNK